MTLPRVNILLGGVVGLLALLVWFGSVPERDRAEAPLTGLEPNAVRHIVVERRGDRQMELTRTSGSWTMVAPYRIAADPERIRALVRIAATPSHRRIPATDANMREFGLTRDALRLKLNGLELAIGGTEPVRRRRYIRVGEDSHLIDDLYQHHLIAGPEAFVDPRPFPDTVSAARLEGRPLDGKALKLIKQSKARRVERGAPTKAALGLEVRLKDPSTSLSFRLDPQGARLWRTDPPLLYLLETPLNPALLDP